MEACGQSCKSLIILNPEMAQSVLTNRAGVCRRSVTGRRSDGMRLSVRLNFSLVAGVTLVSLAIAAYQTQSETRGLKRDLERQASELADSLEKSAAPLVASQSFYDLQRLVDRFQNHQRLAGVAVYNVEGHPV